MAFRIAFNIWFVAVVANALIFMAITLFTGITNGTGPGEMLRDIFVMLVTAFIWTVLFSLPSLILFAIAISICISIKIKGFPFYATLVLTGVALILGTCLGLTALFLGESLFIPILMYPAFISLLTGILWERNSLKELSINNLQTAGHEN